MLIRNASPAQRKGKISIDKLVIGGMQTDYCINATSRKAAALDYSVIVVADGHSTYADDAEAAEHLISQYNHDLAAVVNVTSSENIQFEG